MRQRPTAFVTAEKVSSDRRREIRFSSWFVANSVSRHSFIHISEHTYGLPEPSFGLSFYQGHCHNFPLFIVQFFHALPQSCFFEDSPRLRFSSVRIAFIVHQAVLGLWEFQLDSDNMQWHG